jgi:hypothetical protein
MHRVAGTKHARQTSAGSTKARDVTGAPATILTLFWTHRLDACHPSPPAVQPVQVNKSSVFWIDHIIGHDLATKP